MLHYLQQCVFLTAWWTGTVVNTGGTVVFCTVISAVHIWSRLERVWLIYQLSTIQSHPWSVSMIDDTFVWGYYFISFSVFLASVFPVKHSVRLCSNQVNQVHMKTCRFQPVTKLFSQQCLVKAVQVGLITQSGYIQFRWHRALVHGHSPIWLIMTLNWMVP